jgi:hypothetical protein
MSNFAGKGRLPLNGREGCLPVPPEALFHARRPIRSRTVGCKMTDGEYERLSAVVESEGMTLGEWCREVLLERAEGRKPSVIDEPPFSLYAYTKNDTVNFVDPPGLVWPAPSCR